MGTAAIKPINEGTKEVEVNGVKRHVVRGYEEFVRDAFWDIFSSRKKARKSWVEEYRTAIKHYNDVVEYHKKLATEGLDKQRQFLIQEHNQLVNRLKTLAISIRSKLRKKKQAIPEFITVLLPVPQEQNNQPESITLRKIDETSVELSTVKAITQDPLREFAFLTKQCVSMQREIKKLDERLKAEQKKLDLGNSDDIDARQISRDDVYLDHYAYYNQVVKHSSHPQNIYYFYNDEKLEFCIDNIFPDLEAFIEEQKVFLESQQVSPLSRFFRKLFNVFTDSIDFVEHHQSFISRKELELRLAKQGLAQAAYDRINIGLINNSLDTEKFEKFTKLIEENGNFTVVNVPRSDLEDLLAFVKSEEKNIEVERRSWFGRLFLGDKADYLEHKNYLENLTNRLVTYRQDFRALTNDEYQNQFNQTFSNFKTLENKPDLTVDNLLASEADTKSFIKYIRNTITQKQKQMPQGVKWLWNRIINKNYVVQLQQEIDYLNKLEQSLNRKDLKEEYDVNQDIRLVIENETNSYSGKLIENYNLQRLNDGKTVLHPAALIQLANYTFRLSDNHTRDFFAELLEKFDAYSKFESMNFENFDETKRYAGIRRLLNNPDKFKEFAEKYISTESKKDLSDIDREFLHYVKRVNAATQEPYATLKAQLEIRLDDAYQNMVDLIVYHGVNDTMLSTISNYINIVRYNIESGRTKIEQLEHVKNQSNNLPAEAIKNRFLTALDLLQALVNGESIYRNYETEPAENINLSELNLSLQDENGRKNFQGIKDLCSLLIPAETLNDVGGAVLSEWLMRYVRYNLRKLFNRQGEANYQKNLSQEANIHANSYHFNLIKEFGNGFNPVEQYECISNDAVKFFKNLFENRIAGDEVKLLNLPKTAGEDNDNLSTYLNKAGGKDATRKAYLSAPTENKNNGVEHVKCGKANLQYTIQELIRQQNRISSYSEKNKLKLEYIECYLENYENASVVTAAYAKAITIAATHEQIQKYGQKLLSFIFRKSEVVLTDEEMEFVQDNKQILKDVIDKVINNYINSPNFTWNKKTEITLHEIGSQNNQQRYTTKRIKELLVDAAKAEQKSPQHKIIEQAEAYILDIQNRKESLNFNYPDTNDNFVINELKEVFGVYSNGNQWNVTLDELAALYMKSNPEILQKLRINNVNLILNGVTSKKLVGDDLSDTVLLDSTLWFADYIKTHQTAEGILSSVDEIRKRGLSELNEVFTVYCNETNPLHWHKYAETLICAFDESEKWLREIRLRKVKDLTDKQDLQEAIDYIAYVTSSSKKDLLPKNNDTDVAEGSGRLDEIFRKSIFGQNDIPEIAERNYSWNEVTEILVRQWGTPERLDTCLIARTAHLLTEGNIQLSEQHIIQLLNNPGLNFTKGNLVKTEQGKIELLELLTFYAEKGSWCSNIELLIEYLEPESNNQKLLHQYRFKRLSELMNGVGVVLGQFDIESQNELIEENSQKLFKRNEYEIYQSLQANRDPSAAHISKLEEFFGLENFPAMRGLFGQYIARIEQRIEPDTVAHYLCSTIFTSVFNSKVERLVPEREGENLYIKWLSLLEKFAYVNLIHQKAGDIEGLLRAGAFYGAKRSYNEERQNLKICKQTNNQVGLEKAKKTVIAIENTALEYMKDLIAYSTEVSETSSAIRVLAGKKVQFENSESEKWLQDFANIPLASVASMQLKANIARLLSGNEQRLEIFALKLLGASSMERFPELKEMLIATDNVSYIETYLGYLKNYVNSIESKSDDVESCKKSSKDILKIFINLFCDKQFRYFKDKVERYQIRPVNTDEFNETTLIDSISAIAQNNESVKSKAIAIITEIMNKIGLDVKDLFNCLENCTDQVLETIGQRLNEIVANQREGRKEKIYNLYIYLTNLAQENQVKSIKQIIEGLRDKNNNQGTRKSLLKQLFAQIKHELKDDYILDIEFVINSLTDIEQNQIIEGLAKINLPYSSEQIFEAILAIFKVIIDIFKENEIDTHNQKIDTCVNRRDIQKLLVDVTQSYKEKRINYAVSMILKHDESATLNSTINDLNNEFFASCVEETKEKAEYLNINKQKINDSVKKLDDELNDILGGIKYVGHFDAEKIDSVVKGVDRNRKNQLLLKLEQLLSIFKDCPETDIANRHLLNTIEAICKSIKEGVISNESKQYLEKYKSFVENYTRTYDQVKSFFEKIRNSQSISIEQAELANSFSSIVHTNDRKQIIELINEIRINNPIATNLVNLLDDMFNRKNKADELARVIKHYNSYLNLLNKLDEILKSGNFSEAKILIENVEAVFFNVKDDDSNNSIVSTLAAMKNQLLSRLFNEPNSKNLLDSTPRTIWISADALFSKIASVEQIAQLKVAGGNFVLETIRNELNKQPFLAVTNLDTKAIKLLKEAVVISDKVRDGCLGIIERFITEKNKDKVLYVIDLIIEFFDFVDEKVKNKVVVAIVQSFKFIDKEKYKFLQMQFEEKVLAGYINSQYQDAVNAIDKCDLKTASEIIDFFGSLDGSEEVSSKFSNLSKMQSEKQKQITNCIKAIKGEIDVFPELIKVTMQAYQFLPENSKVKNELQNSINDILKSTEPKKFKLEKANPTGVFGYLKTRVNIRNLYRGITPEASKQNLIQSFVNKVSLAYVAVLFGTDESYKKQVQAELASFINDYINYIEVFVKTPKEDRLALDCGFSYATNLLLTIVDNEKDRKKLESAIARYNTEMNNSDKQNNPQSPNQGSGRYQFFPAAQNVPNAVENKPGSSSPKPNQ